MSWHDKFLSYAGIGQFVICNRKLLQLSLLTQNSGKHIWKKKIPWFSYSYPKEVPKVTLNISMLTQLTKIDAAGRQCLLSSGYPGWAAITCGVRKHLTQLATMTAVNEEPLAAVRLVISCKIFCWSKTPLTSVPDEFRAHSMKHCNQVEVRIGRLCELWNLRTLPLSWISPRVRCSPPCSCLQPCRRFSSSNGGM